MAYNYTTNTRSDLTSNLHYIGARYVPAWYEDSNEGNYQWDSDTAYPALIIVKYSVTDSDGIEEPHYYISKKPVPNTVGAPPENATYWADLGVSSEYLNNRINKVIEDAEKEAETRQAQINEVNSKVDAEIADREDGDKQLQENLDNAVTNLQAQLTSVKESAVTDVSMTNEDGVYSFTKTINGTSSDVGTVNVKEDNCVVELADNVVETTEGNYQNDYHNLVETTQDGTQNTIEQFRIARKQITNIEQMLNGNIEINYIDQSGAESQTVLYLPEVESSNSVYFKRKNDEIVLQLSSIMSGVYYFKYQSRDISILSDGQIVMSLNLKNAESYKKVISSYLVPGATDEDGYTYFTPTLEGLIFSDEELSTITIDVSRVMVSNSEVYTIS